MKRKMHYSVPDCDIIEFKYNRSILILSDDGGMGQGGELEPFNDDIIDIPEFPDPLEFL